MRKGRYYLQLLVAALSTVAFTACNPDDVESAVDTLPMPSEYEANKDKSVKPGDSFFDYCNGSWLAAHPIPTDPTVNLGGLYGAAEVMEQRVEQLKKSNPDIGRYYTLVDEIHEHSKAARQYIAEQKGLPGYRQDVFRGCQRAGHVVHALLGPDAAEGYPAACVAKPHRRRFPGRDPNKAEDITARDQGRQRPLRAEAVGRGHGPRPLAGEDDR